MFRMQFMLLFQIFGNILFIRYGLQKRGFDIGRVQSCVLRLPNIDPPPPHPPLHPASVPSPHNKGGVHSTYSPGGEGGGG
jgi:hypothetical protein